MAFDIMRLGSFCPETSAVVAVLLFPMLWLLASRAEGRNRLLSRPGEKDFMLHYLESIKAPVLGPEHLLCLEPSLARYLLQYINNGNE